MREYLAHPGFWLSVAIVAVVINWVWVKFVQGKKLI